MNYTNIILIIFLLLTMSLTSWTILYNNRTIISQDNITRPDAIIEEVVAHTLDKNGYLSLKIVSPKIFHYSKANITNLLHPEITIFGAARDTKTLPWQINADFAKASSGIQQLTLWQHVIILQQDHGKPATLINTESLTIFPEEEMAKTAALITIKQPGFTLQGQGMSANLHTGEVQLLHQVSGGYS